MRIISLFSGAGGLDLGLIQAGNKIVWANDIDKDAVATYKENISSDIVCDDIKNIDLDTLPSADVVVGGFPCQGFSQANMRRVLDDPRNMLYKFFYQTIKTKKPKFFIAENVRGILSLGNGEAITNDTAPQLLEAAHIKPKKYNGCDEIANGLAMRPDIHLLFDTGNLRISPDGEVELSSIARENYGWSIPSRISIPEFTNRQFLRWRWENYNGI